VTDPGLIAKKLAFVETCLRELRTLARPDAIDADVRERRFVEHTLQLAIQACQDVASHIVSDEHLGEPRTNQELFQLLRGAGWLNEDVAEALRRAVGFRNVLVHGYTAVDSAVVLDILEHHLGDLEAFVDAVRARLGHEVAEP